MSEYLENVIRASGGHSAPVENLEYDFVFDEEDLLHLAEIGKDYEGLAYEEDEDRPEAPQGYHYMPDGELMRDTEHEEESSVQATAGSKPAPKKDQIKGSNKNPKGSASGGESIDFSQKVVKALQKKADQHNEKHGDAPSKKTSLKTLKAVYRRGAGAFSTSHRPDQNRNSWAMARVNAFLHLLRTGSPKNSKYVTDNDLLPAAHNRSSKKSAAITAAGDPCWSGYVQVGMKEKNGKRVPNCVPSAAAIDYVVASINSEFGSSRHVDTEAAYAVARKACDKYDYLPDEELYSAIMWDLHNYADYATTGSCEEDMSEYSEYLPEGHPDKESSLVASLVWLSGAPELDNSSRDVVISAFSDTSDYVSALHASTRLKVLISSGALSETTTQRLKTIAELHAKVD